MNTERLRELAGIKPEQDLLLTEASPDVFAKIARFANVSRYKSKADNAVKLLVLVKEDLKNLKVFLTKLSTEETIFKGDEEYKKQLEFFIHYHDEMFKRRDSGTASVLANFKHIVKQLT